MHFTRKTSLRPAGVTVWSTEIQSISPWEIKLDELSCIELKNDKIQSGKRTIVSFTIVFGCHIHFFVFSKRLFRCSLYLSNITLSTGAFELVDCDVVLQFMNCLTGNFLPLCGKVKKTHSNSSKYTVLLCSCICHICSFASDDSAIRICHCLLTISLSCWSLWLNSVMKVILFVFWIEFLFSVLQLLIILKCSCKFCQLCKSGTFLFKSWISLTWF